MNEEIKGDAMALQHRHWLSLIVSAITLLAGAALPVSAPAETVIKIGGTGCALGTVKQLAEAYEKSHPGIRVQILPSLGSTGGIKAALGGSIDLALSSRSLSREEQEQGAKSSEYARSPFVFVTNAKVSKRDITIRELEGIYANPAASWPDGSRIRLILRPEKDVDSQVIRGISPGMELAVKSAQARPGMIVAITDQEASDAIAKTAGALGGATLTEIISENRPVNILSLNGVVPSVKSIADRSYPLVKPLFLVTTTKTPAEARKFAEYIHTPAAGKILTKNGNLLVNVR